MPRGGQNVNNTPLTEAQQRLVADHFLFARKLARPLKARYPQWYEELDSAACLGLVKAAQSFDPGRSYRFATFAAYRVRGYLYDTVEACLADRRPRVTPGSLIDPGPDPAFAIEQSETVDRVLRSLPPKTATALRLYAIDGHDQAEAARIMGCSYGEVRRLMIQAKFILTG